MQQGMPEQMASPRKSNKLTWILAGCVIPILLIVCCVVGIALVYLVSPSTLEPALALLGLSGKAQAATYAPVQAPLFVSMDIDLKQVANAQRIASLYEKSTQAQSSTSDFKRQFRDSSGCDFDLDIMPWIGTDVAVFLTDDANLNATASTSRGTPAPPPNLVIAVGTRDAAKAQAAMQKCALNKSTKSEETYKGNKISVYESGGAMAVVGKYVLLASTTTALHASIDASRSDIKSLDENVDYTNMLARLQPSRTATAYMQFSPFVAAAARSSTGIQPQTLSQLEAYKTLGASLSFEATGIRMDFVLSYDSAKLSECTRQLMQQPANPNQAIKAMPANTMMFLSASNFKSTWDCTLSQLDATSRKQMQDSLTSAGKQLGIDIDADVFSWLTGEYGIVVTPAQPLSPGAPGVGGYLLVETKDQNLVNTKMTKIAGALGKQGLTFKDQNVKGLTMKTFSLGAPNDPTAPVAGYGTVGNFLILGGPLDVLGAAVDAPKNPLANDATFLATQKILPAKNSGYFYANMSALDKLFLDSQTGTQRSTYQQEAQPWLKPIKGIGWAAEVGKPDVTSGTLFVYIPGE